ncbi:MAG: HEAT repeat domain-containing protein [Myxococcales bacterium]|nr:HEAT repeat domain-containing protein [Myxococcales bacterium]
MAKPIRENLQTTVDNLRDSDPRIRRTALSAYGRLTAEENIYPDEATVRVIYKLLFDPDAGVRLQACTALALMPGPVETLNHRVDALEARLADHHPQVRAQAVAAIGDLAKMDITIPASIVDILASWVSLPEPQGFEAAYTLAILKDIRGQNRLEASLQVSGLQALALEGIGRLRQTSSLPVLRRYAGRWFITWSDRFVAWAIMAHLGDETGIYQIRRNLRSKHFEERIFMCVLSGQWRIEGTRTTLRQLATEPHEAAQEAAIEALGNIGHAHDRHFLETLLRDTSLSSDTQQVAQQALRHLLTQTPL